MKTVHCKLCDKDIGLYGWTSHVAKEKRIHGEDCYKKEILTLEDGRIITVGKEEKKELLASVKEGKESMRIVGATVKTLLSSHELMGELGQKTLDFFKAKRQEIEKERDNLGGKNDRRT